MPGGSVCVCVRACVCVGGGGCFSQKTTVGEL